MSPIEHKAVSLNDWLCKICFRCSASSRLSFEHIALYVELDSKWYQPSMATFDPSTIMSIICTKLAYMMHLEDVGGVTAGIHRNEDHILMIRVVGG
jgi:hypothetical protein